MCYVGGFQSVATVDYKVRQRSQSVMGLQRELVQYANFYDL